MMMMIMMMMMMMILQKLMTSQGGARPDSEPEHVISIIERPSQLMMASPAQHPSLTTPAIPPPPLLRPSLARVPSVAPPAVVTQGQPDINQQLVERIDELYRQLHPTRDTAAPTATAV